MSNYKLPHQTTINTLELTIRDLERSIAFYTQVIGFHLRDQKKNITELGTSTQTLLKLIENPDAQKFPRTTGLYHFAILVPERRHLAEALDRIIRTETPVQGFADHGVSEAIYLPDPDGNGIEIYRDLPKQVWPFNNGELQMVTDPLDLDHLLAELNGNRTSNANFSGGTIIGHMHLHIRDLPEAVAFYRDILGFDLKQRYGSSAAFLAAGDYHHHIGINTWAGVGAQHAPLGSVGLRSFSVALPEADILRDLQGHIHHASVETTNHNDHAFSVKDPSGNQIKFHLASLVS